MRRRSSVFIKTRRSLCRRIRCTTSSRREDVARVYDIYKKGNLFERVPYVQAAAFKFVIDQQSDPQMAALMKGVDYKKAVDNGPVDRLVKEGFFEKLFGPGVKAEQDRKAKLAFR